MSTDAELVERLADDDTGESLRTLYRRHCDELYGFAYSALRDRGAADELVQDVFTSVWRHADRFDHQRGNVRAWMYGIARNAVIDRRRRASVRPRVAAFADDPAQEAGAVDASIEHAGLRWQLAAALDQLSPDHRDVVRLAHYEGMTMSEIAVAKGVPIGTIKSRAWYALNHLRRVITQSEAPCAA